MPRINNNNPVPPQEVDQEQANNRNPPEARQWINQGIQNIAPAPLDVYPVPRQQYGLQHPGRQDTPPLMPPEPYQPRLEFYSDAELITARIKLLEIVINRFPEITLEDLTDRLNRLERWLLRGR